MRNNELEIINKENLKNDLVIYIRSFFNSNSFENESLIKIYFGENRYNKQEINLESLNLYFTSLQISKTKPYLIQIISGIIRAGGKYKVDNGNGGWSGKGFMVDVSFSIEIDSYDYEFKNLQLRST